MKKILIPCINIVYRLICLKNFMIFNSEAQEYTGMEKAESLIV